MLVCVCMCDYVFDNSSLGIRFQNRTDALFNIVLVQISHFSFRNRMFQFVLCLVGWACIFTHTTISKSICIRQLVNANIDKASHSHRLDVQRPMPVFSRKLFVNN